MALSFDTVEPILDDHGRLIASLSPAEGIMITIEPLGSPDAALDFHLLDPKDAHLLGSTLVEWARLKLAE